MLCTVALAACAAPPAPTAAPAPSAAAAPTEAAACAARHGVIKPVCRMGKPMCVISYADAGKPCRGDADCEGRCLAEPGTGSAQGAPAKGVCQADSNPCGCTTWVENGVVAGSICVD